jgi:hypothetical protein
MDVNVTMTGAGANPLFDIDVTAIYTGNVIDIVFSSAAATGDAVSVDMGTDVTGSAIALAAAGARSDDLIKIDDSSTGSGQIFDINISGVYTGNVIDIVFSAAATGEAINIDMATAVAGSALVIAGAGARTDDYIKIDDTSTSNSQVFDINISGNSTANVLDIVMSGTKVAGHAVHTDMGTDLAGNAFLIDAAGARTAPLIYVANTATDAGTDDHVMYINQTGLLNSNLIQLTFGTAASDGEAISIAMGTNVAGRAIYVSSAATGVSGDGAAFDVEHTGDLVAGADVVTIHSTGNISATSNLLAIEQDTGAGSTGAYGLYINCTGTNVEAIKVDAGAVVFDETLTVTGATTLSSTLSYKQLTEVVTEANVITAAESGSVFFLNAEAEFASTLPALAAGLHFTFIVTAAPSGAAYTIATNSGDNVILGQAHSSTGGDADSETTGCDTINFVDGTAVVGDTVTVWCDGTNWFAHGFCNADGGITFTTAA